MLIKQRVQRLIARARRGYQRLRRAKTQMEYYVVTENKIHYIIRKDRLSIITLNRNSGMKAE